MVWDEFPEAAHTSLYAEYHEAVRQDRAVEFTLFYEPLDMWSSVRAVPYADGLLVFFRPITADKLIEARARVYAAQDAALREVATAVARGAEVDEIFALIARKTGALLGADAAGVLQLEAGGDGAHLIGSWSKGALLVEAGTYFPDIRQLAIGPILRSEQPTITLHYDEHSESVIAKQGYRCSLVVALSVENRV